MAVTPAAIYDYRYTQYAAVAVRWFLLVGYLSLLNYRSDNSTATLLLLNGVAITIAVMNGFLNWRLTQRERIGPIPVISLSAIDLSAITIGIAVTSQFENTFFVLYYPALLGMALVVPSRLIAFVTTSLVATAYSAISVAMEPGVSFSEAEEKILIVRIIAMFGVTAAGTFISRIERRVAAEFATRGERQRIGRDFHDGLSQTMWAMKLNAETTVELADREKSPLTDRLNQQVLLSQRLLLETRHYIHDLRPADERSSDLLSAIESLVGEFEMISGISAQCVSRVNHPPSVSPAQLTAFSRILQESLANVLKHAAASNVIVTLDDESSALTLKITDDGVGLGSESEVVGYGVDNMRVRAIELGGTFSIRGNIGGGVTATTSLPFGSAASRGKE